MNMSKKQFRIGDLAEELNVKKFVIRFWEKEFGIESDRSQGGQRFYTSDDLRRFLLIKDLLYNQGFTIAGAKKQLASVGDKSETIVEQRVVTEQEQVMVSREPVNAEPEQQMTEQETQQNQSVPAVEHEEITPATKILPDNEAIVQQCNELKQRLMNLKTLLEQ